MRTYRARWIAPVDGPPIEGGEIVVEAGRIISVGPAGSQTPDTIDFGDAIIVPGFVNAHTHLELTQARGRLAQGGAFTDWIKRVIPLHPARGSADDHRAAIREGVRQSLAAGVVAVGDIGSGAVARDEWARAELHSVGFLEVNGMGPKLAANPNLDDVLSRLASLTRWGAGIISLPHNVGEGRGGGILPASGGRDARPPSGTTHYPCPIHRLGISPHAPYSTDLPVYQRAIELATRTRRPITTHLAETREEEQFLREGTGPFRKVLEEFGLWDGSFSPPRCSPVEYAARMGLLACRPVLAHVNYPSDDDLDQLAGSKASVAFCPRSHVYFGHAPHRWRDMLARGINVCLGTDSLASNETLSILDEMRFIRAADTSASPEMLLRMGTLNGALALGLASEIGSLAPGKRADFVMIPLANPNTRDPLGDLLESGLPPAAVFMTGERVIG